MSSRVSDRTFQLSWTICILLFVILFGFTILFMYIPIFSYIFLEEEMIWETGSIGNLLGVTMDYSEGSLDIGKIVLFLGVFNVMDLTCISLIVLFILPSLYYRKDYFYRTAVDTYLPNLLREISDAQKVGMPLPRAVLASAKRQYGPLTPELQKMASKMSWGIGFNEALRGMADNINTALFRRVTLLILEAERAGGSIEDVFDAAHSHVSELLGLRRERLQAMAPYTMIIYASFIVFALVIVILLESFFTTLAVSGTAVSGGVASAGLPIPLVGIQVIFFHLLMIEASFSGLVAGKMGSGNTMLGLKHNMVLVFLGYALMRLVLII